jgi:hypothetical protein
MRVLVRRGRVALMVRMVRAHRLGVRRGVIAVSGQAAVMGRDVDAVRLLITIHVDRLRTG